jgi:hypothetical protein
MNKTSKLNLNLSNKLVKFYIRRIAFYGADTWRLRQVDQRYLGGFEMWCWRRREMASWKDDVENKEVYHGVKEERNICIQ